MAINDAGSVSSSARPSALTTVLLLAITSLVGNITYRLYFHPLAKYPGPLLARISGWPSYWHTLHGNRHIWLWKLQEKYGSTIRYTPNSVVINTATGFRTIFGPRGNVKKSSYYEVWPRNVHAVNTWDSISTSQHSRKRRVLAQAFSDRALRAAEGYVNHHVDHLCELIAGEIKDDGWTSSMNMSDWSTYLVFDILGELCFGRPFGMKSSSEMRYVPELLVSFLQLVHPIAFSPWADLWVWLKPRGLDWIFEHTKPADLKKWTAFVDNCLAERTAAEDALVADPNHSEADARKDFYHYLAQANDPETGEKGYEKNELFGEIELLIIAGSDTTSIVFAAMFFYLARNPAIQQRLAAEVSAAFKSAADIKSGARLHECKYFRAFIQEACRMTPPVAAEPAREVLPGGMAVDGNFFEEGTKVSTGLYALSYNDEVFPDPFKFQPERWLTDDTDLLARQELGFCAFSFGSRGCVGKNLAMLEMTLAMAKVVWSFEIRQDAKDLTGGGRADLQEGRRCEEQYQIFDAFVAVRHGPMVHFRKRVHS